MTQIDINSLLTQMRSLSAQLEPNAAAAPVAGDTKPQDSFGNLLKQSIADVSQTQNHAQQMTTAFERGDPGADLPHVMLAVQKADLSFRAMTEVRNKLVDAYQNIMNMPL
ncbi:MAG TPA: flagellar hook-basal body complex protein FliE [Rhodanobacteraceae bacterium]|nr:flagellar hook-basal body complex protein FliE [Oleiagrimonas sp.]HET9819527.1 flagellar hook-basal body complex protein FliE [Rhodanobacteraceae bacterium]